MDDVIKDYIFQCKEVLESNDSNRADKLINKIVGVFGNEITNITHGLDSYTSYLGNHQIDYLGDIELLKDKLTLYSAQSNIAVNNNANADRINSSVIFQNARNEVESEGSLSEQERHEIFDKIDEIEEISKSTDPPNIKWVKLRPTMEWLGTKGVTAATAILNLITKILSENIKGAA